MKRERVGDVLKVAFFSVTLSFPVSRLHPRATPASPTPFPLHTPPRCRPPSCWLPARRSRRRRRRARPGPAGEKRRKKKKRNRTVRERCASVPGACAWPLLPPTHPAPCTSGWNVVARGGRGGVPKRVQTGARSLIIAKAPAPILRVGVLLSCPQSPLLSPQSQLPGGARASPGPGSRPPQRRPRGW
jgi:hypothetical protein